MPCKGLMVLQALTGLIGVAVGTTMRVTAGQRIATTIRRATATTIWAFACAVQGTDSYSKFMDLLSVLSPDPIPLTCAGYSVWESGQRL